MWFLNLIIGKSLPIFKLKLWCSKWNADPTHFICLQVSVNPDLSCHYISSCTIFHCKLQYLPEILWNLKKVKSFSFQTSESERKTLFIHVCMFWVGFFVFFRYRINVLPKHHICYYSSYEISASFCRTQKNIWCWCLVPQSIPVTNIMGTLYVSWS